MREIWGTVCPAITILPIQTPAFSSSSRLAMVKREALAYGPKSEPENLDVCLVDPQKTLMHYTILRSSALTPRW